MIRYCAYTFDPSERPQPSFDDAVEFFQTLHRRAIPVQHCATIARFLRWHNKQRSDDALKRKLYGTTRGLLHHIKSVHDWYDTSKDDLKGWLEAANGRSASSDTEIGTRTDRQCHEIFSGRVPDRPESYAAWLVMYMYEQRWMPCAMQVPIWSHDNTVRTQADIIAYDMVQKRFVLIELKTGYDVNYEFVMRERGELDFFAKTSRNMCHLQLGWMYANLLRDRTHPAPLAAYVVRIGGEAGLRRPEPVCATVMDYYITMARVESITLYRDSTFEVEYRQRPALPLKDDRMSCELAEAEEAESDDALFVHYPYAEEGESEK